MKSKKWLTYTLGVLITLVVLAAVGGVGFRIGAMQSASFTKMTAGQSAQMPLFAHGHNMDGGFNNQMERGNSSHRFDGGRGGNRGGPFSHIFGLFHLIVLGALVWLGYKLIKNSGWKLVKATSSEAAAPAAEAQSAAVAGDEEKE